MMRTGALTHLLVAGGAAGIAVAACSPLRDWVTPRSIAREAPQSPVVPLTAPALLMKGEKGPAPAKYPAGFVASIKPDGTILFPEGTAARIKGPSVVLGGQPILTVTNDGEVKGNGLKRPYKFTADGDLVDADGRGVRLSPTGGVRTIGGAWRNQDVFVWAPEGGGAWDKTGWRTLAIVALVMIENMLPDALRPAERVDDASAPEPRGGIYIPPPSEWFK